MVISDCAGGCRRIFPVAAKNTKAAEAANVRLDRDTKLYENIKAGMREYHWREREQPLWKAKHLQKVFETAHLAAFHLDHFAESRVGFYFKDLDKYGMYSFFAGTAMTSSRATTELTAASRRKGICIHGARTDHGVGIHPGAGAGRACGVWVSTEGGACGSR
ncbi:hypothetical protein [Bradyrhizobium sp. STM 3557]|uniref:hypothetical protein n=1 Tax=Bradyrhizobium sp. STM 3557 TaxID=578920 RepID=UPI00388EDD20